ncbi:MAG TPA: methanogenesis marker protein 11 [Candidatus Methanoperedens sp.]
MHLQDPYNVPYKGIYAVADRKNEYVEIMEHSNCYGGSAWALYHYSKSPLVIKSRSVGDMMRYLVRVGRSNLELQSSTAAAGIESIILNGDEIEITYSGLGGGGVGATTCRACANGVLRSSISESGGGKRAGGTIVVPRRERILVGMDNTDSKEVGATWTLAHNIGAAVDSLEHKYISHTLVQLYPVPDRTQNCVGTVLEFACMDGAKEDLLAKIKEGLLKYSVSSETGMVALSEFDAYSLMEYSRLCRSKMISKELTLETAAKNNVEICIDGKGIIGALAALPWFSRNDESVFL